MKQEDIPADSWKLLENPRPSLVEKITLNRPHKILGRLPEKYSFTTHIKTILMLMTQTKTASILLNPKSLMHNDFQKHVRLVIKNFGINPTR
jgi:hypothetical protein